MLQTVKPNCIGLKIVNPAYYKTAIYLLGNVISVYFKMILESGGVVGGENYCLSISESALSSYSARLTS